MHSMPEQRFSAVWRITACVMLCISLLARAQPADPQARHAAVRNRLRAHLQSALIPWWVEHSPDTEFGGFLCELERDGSVRSGEKMLVSQARQIWSFARLWRSGYRDDPRVHDAAVRGLHFLLRHFWDREHGGFIYRAERAGRVQSDRKDTYAHAFVIYAGVEFHRAFGDPAGLQVAQAAFDALERHAKDPEYPGYFSQLSRDWDVGRRGRASKSMNTQLHLLEAFSELYAETRDQTVGRRLKEILDALVEHAYLPSYGCCIELFQRNWQPFSEGWGGRRNQTTSYGHNVEFAWLMQRAREVLELPEQPYRSVALSLIDHALEYGWHSQAGALCSEGPLQGSPSDCTMSWWPQAENLVALDWAWRATGQTKYLAALERQAAWVIEHQADQQFGGWWDEVAPDGAVENRRKAHLWHAAYHEVRGVLNVASGEW